MMLNNYQLNQIKIIIAALKKQIKVPKPKDCQNLESGISCSYDFGWMANATEVKELLGGSLGSVLIRHPWILNQLSLRIISVQHRVLDRWRGFQWKTTQILAPKYDQTIEEALSDNHLETHQSLLNKLLQLTHFG